MCQDLVVIPAFDFFSGDARRVPLSEGLARDGESLGREVVDARIFQCLSRSVEHGAFLSYSVLFFDREWLERFACS